MAEAKPNKVKVEAIKYHTNAGVAYDVGDTYDVAEDATDNLAYLGMAIRVDRKAVAQKAAKPAKAAPAKKVAKSRRK